MNRQMSQKSGAARRSSAQTFTEKQGQYLAFIYAYARMFRRSPAEADMQRHFGVSPPSGRHCLPSLSGRCHLPPSTPTTGSSGVVRPLTFTNFERHFVLQCFNQTVIVRRDAEPHLSPLHLAISRTVLKAAIGAFEPDECFKSVVMCEKL